MAGPHTAGILPQPVHIIDLTASDDEDEPQRRASTSHSIQAFTTSLPQDLPPSNHGLLLPGTFNSTQHHSGEMAQGGIQMVLPLGGPGAQPQASILRGTNLSRASTGQSFPRTIITALDRHMSVEEHPSKRRKTSGGTGAQEIPASVPARLTKGSEFQSHQRRNSPITEAQPIVPSRPAAILPPARHSVRGLDNSQINQWEGGAQNELSLLSLSRSSDQKRKTSKGERLHADILRVTLNAMVQNQRIVLHHTSSMPNSPEPAETYDIIRKQVTKELVEDHSFAEHLQMNGRKLTLAYESEVSIKAQTLVDKYASEILHCVKLGSVGRSTAEPFPESAPPYERQASISTRSATEEEVFEIPAIADSKPIYRVSWHSPSSPTTSLSIDVNDRTSPVDFGEHHSQSTEIKGDTENSVQVEDSDAATIAVRVKQSLASSSAMSGLKRRQDKSFGPQKLTSKKYLCRLRSSRISKPLEGEGHRLPTELKNPGLRDHQKLENEIQILKLAAGDKGISRPYLSFRDREDIRSGIDISDKYRGYLSRSKRASLQNSIFHVDFSPDEVEFLCKTIQKMNDNKMPLAIDLENEITRLMNVQEDIVSRLLSNVRQLVNKPAQRLGWTLLQRRNMASIEAFLHDAMTGTNAKVPQAIRVESLTHKKRPQIPQISSLLRQREVYGRRSVRVQRGQRSFKEAITTHFEDTLVPKSEWTDCCGDISTLSWTGEASFICGATAHSDYHNMQYNKPGNLAVGSCSLDILRAVADHRIIRPLITTSDNVENALESMRQTQDPWLYTSVVSSSHCQINGLTFTASFDHTVKVWHIADNGLSINLCGTWPHTGTVNFVVTSIHHERVATASDVSSNAIRIYKLDEGKGDIDRTPYDTYCGEKALEQALDQSRDKWAYFPATIQWGKALGVVDFLLVGYSPRSMTNHDMDIPEDKKNSGELCLWNVKSGTRISISSTRTQNVFEVLWHPTQPIFLAATSPCGNFERETRTQIRVFAQNKFGIFFHIKALDCPACDINELTIMPNSWSECYVTASCTDGNTYVWDTAQGDRPIHTLGHSASIDELLHDLPREIADTGVKFAAWGKTVDRFYTGSSDGKVKAWDIRRPKGQAFVRTVLSVSGVITAGAFSSNFSNLLIGDATGKVHLLETHEHDNDIEEFGHGNYGIAPYSASTSLARRSEVFVPETHYKYNFLVRRPMALIHHPQPSPPEGFRKAEEAEEATAHDIASDYLKKGFLTMHPDPGIGPIQGPNYAETGLFLNLAHECNDPALPLLPEWRAERRFVIQDEEPQLRFVCLPRIDSSGQSVHENNMSLDLDFFRLSLSTQAELVRGGVDLDFEPAQDFDYELSPRLSIFKCHKNHKGRTLNM